MEKQKKNKLCPRRKVCRDACYGDIPCDFAKALDKLQSQNDKLLRKIAKLERRNEELEKEVKDTQSHYETVIAWMR